MGGIVSSLQMPLHGRLQELLYQHEWFWDASETRTRGGLPFLFPVCGRLERGGEDGAYQCHGAYYHLPIHGFAMRMPWRVADTAAADALVIELSDTDATRAAYPFEFRLRLTWRISSGRLACTQEYDNTGAEPLPYYAGFHPYFTVPAPHAGKDAVQLSYSAQHKLVYNQRLTDVVGRVPAPRCPLSICAPDINESLLAVPDGSAARMAFGDGTLLEVSARGLDADGMFPFMQFYTMPEKAFFCMEPWMGLPNALNSMHGARWLAPGATERARFECRLVPPA